MLRRADNIRIDVRKKWLTVYAGKTVVRREKLRGAEKLIYRLKAAQARVPVVLAVSGGRTYWWFQNSFYWSNESLEPVDVEALIRDRERKQRRRVERAKASMNLADERPVTARQPIPDDVKMFVWRRDQGCCVRCGSQDRLEFDHVIPVTMGGSNTERNLQLLCERCNREKGGHLS